MWYSPKIIFSSCMNDLWFFPTTFMCRYSYTLKRTIQYWDEEKMYSHWNIMLFISVFTFSFKRKIFSHCFKVCWNFDTSIIETLHLILPRVFYISSMISPTFNIKHSTKFESLAFLICKLFSRTINCLNNRTYYEFEGLPQKLE